ncbi:MAG: GNAT family protein [Saprospiraceae bacterium]
MNNAVLRTWQISDVDSLVKYANNAHISNMLMDRFPHPMTEVNAIEFIENANKLNPALILAISIDGIASGGIGIHPQEDIFHKNAELGYWIAEDHWGKGLMTKLVKEMCDYVFLNFPTERIFARPFGSNIASQRVLEKNGFVFEAKLKQTIFKNNQYEDEMIYSIRRPSLKNPSST